MWNSILDFLGKFVTPDWGALIGLMPLLLLGPVALFVAAMAALWAWHAIRRPRPRARLVEGPHAAALDDAGEAVYPAGLPHCRHDRLVYEPGATRCERCGSDLGVTCPMCGVARSASVDTCGNCGLVLKIAARDRLARPAGPPPGGAAIA